MNQVGLGEVHGSCIVWPFFFPAIGTLRGVDRSFGLRAYPPGDTAIKSGHL